MDQQQGEFYVALQNLREDLKEHRAETREDIKSLELKTDQWREEVRAEFGEVKERLSTIETQIATKDSVKKIGWERVLSIAAVAIASVTAWILAHK